ncbi:MAG TPA: hypothetical protein VHM25_24520, partial [Polyangiaceae bacterium]|nr:hypothetical protein [Polyangiaceae bacterium]
MAEEAKRLTGAQRAVTALATHGGTTTASDVQSGFGNSLTVQLTGRDGRDLASVKLNGKSAGHFTQTDR